MNSKITLSIPEIAKKIKVLDLSSYDLVVGIANGAIVLASLLAYEAELELRIIQISFRDNDNRKKFDEPKLLQGFSLDKKYNNILLVDDVSVTKKTLDKAKEVIACQKITTLVIKGEADIVLFEKISECIILPWRDY